MRLPSRESHREQGTTLIVCLILVAFLASLGMALVATSVTDFKIAGSHRDMTEARYLAEAGLQTIVAKQNDDSHSPRYLFDGDTYQALSVDPWFLEHTQLDPNTGKSLGTVSRRIIGGKDPLLNPPPYRVRSSATVRGATRTLEAEIAPLSLLEYALWTEDRVHIAPYITYGGKVYSATYIKLTGTPVTFLRKVEFVTYFQNSSYGVFQDDVVHLSSPKPSLTSLVDLDFYRDAAKEAGVCDAGYGLHLSPDARASDMALFTRNDGGATEYQIDLTLFDFSGPTKTPVEAIKYNGVALSRYEKDESNNWQPLIDFNGVIYSTKQLHVWGINGGRSVEDVAWRDQTTANPDRYYGPNGRGNNWYSNHQLDPSEDGTNGGVADGALDPRKLGRSLTIVTKSGRDIFVDHNIFMGVDPDGTPVRTALISGRAVHVLANAPKTIVIQAALMSMGTSNCSGGTSNGYSWLPCGGSGSPPGDHVGNYWARIPNTSPIKYKYDLDHDGVVEWNNGAPQSSDRNENSMLNAWSLQVLGNRIFQGKPASGVWASGGHLRYYTYDETLLIHEPPCYPVLPVYDLVPGSVAEIRE